MTSDAILVVGGSGFVGGRAVQAIAARMPVAWTFRTRRFELPGDGFPLDFGAAEDDSLETRLARLRPRAIVHAAVPHTRATLDEHRRASVDGLRRLRRAARGVGLEPRLVYVSTNAVYGSIPGPHGEASPSPDPADAEAFGSGPLAAYGRARAEGEKLALEEWSQALVVRTSLVQGRLASGELLPRFAAMVDALERGEGLTRLVDRRISPTGVDDLVAAIVEMLEPDFPHRGILHVVAPERLSDYDYGRRLCDHLGVSRDLVRGETLADRPDLAGMATDMTLVSDRADVRLRTRIAGIDEQLERQLGPRRSR